MDGKKPIDAHYNMHATPLMSHPYPIKKHVDNLSPESLRSLKQMIGRKLLKMHYAKQLEEIYDLYDMVGEQEKDKNTEEILKDSNEKTQNYAAFGAVFSLTVMMGFLGYKKLPVLHLDSWIKEIYMVSYLGLFSFTLIKFFAERRNYYKYSDQEFSLNIFHTRNQIHANNLNILNSLRFNREEII